MSKIAIVGCGAMGSVYAAFFAQAGNEVWVLDVDDAHIRAIARNGLRIEGFSGNRVVHGINAVTTPERVGPSDLVVIATKAADVGAAASIVAPLLRRDTTVLTIQNGLGAGERIARYLPSDRILIGVAEAFGASVRGPGVVHHNSMKMIRLGEFTGGDSDRLRKVASMWQAAGFNAEAFEDINQLVWEKFVCNVAFSAPCTVFDKTMGEVMSDTDMWKIASNCALEAYRVGIALGVHFSYDDAIAYVRDFGSRMPNARPSMLLDHMAGRRSEIDAINGMVPVVARRVNGEAPCNEVVTAIVRQRETAFD